MKHTTIKEIPARTVSVDTFTCDYCGCAVVERTLCVNCQGHFCSRCWVYDDGDDWGDYPPQWCLSCWGAGDASRVEMATIQEQAHGRLVRVRDLWHSRGKEMAAARRAILMGVREDE